MMNVELYQHLDADGRCWLDERAAIREYDGGATREDAEQRAFLEVDAARRKVGRRPVA